MLPALRELARDRGIEWYMHIQAVEAVIAAAKGAGAESLEAALDWAATIAADETDDWSMRLSAGSELLDFPRDGHRLLLTELADQQKGVDHRFFPGRRG